MFHGNKKKGLSREKREEKEMKWEMQIQAVGTQEGRMSLTVLGLADSASCHLWWAAGLKAHMLILSLFGQYV